MEPADGRTAAPQKPVEAFRLASVDVDTAAIRKSAQVSECGRWLVAYDQENRPWARPLLSRVDE